LNTLSLFAGCVLIWGTTWLAITFQLGSVAPEVSVSYRFLLAAALIAAFCRLRGLPMRFRAAEHAALAALGVLMYSVGYILVYHAEAHVVSGLLAVAYSAGPLFAMFSMRLVFGQPMTPRMASGSILGIAGIALVFWPEIGHAGHRGNFALGALLIVLAVLASTAGMLVAHRNHERKLRGWPTMAWSMGYGGAASLAVALAMGRSLSFDFSPAYVLSLLYLTVFGSILGFAGYLTLLGRIGAARASYIGVMVPIVALVVSSLFEGFAWHPLTAAGIAISLAGNVLVLRRPA
jgi:drug/metabolite transporter (DMT)-like permease